MHLYLQRRNVAAQVAEELKTITYTTTPMEECPKQKHYGITLIKMQVGVDLYVIWLCVYGFMFVFCCIICVCVLLYVCVFVHVYYIIIHIPSSSSFHVDIVVSKSCLLSLPVRLVLVLKNVHVFCILFHWSVLLFSVNSLNITEV